MKIRAYPKNGLWRFEVTRPDGTGFDYGYVTDYSVSLSQFRADMRDKNINITNVTIERGRYITQWVAD